MNEISRIEPGMVVREVPSGQDVRLFHGPYFVNAGFRKHESIIEGGQPVSLQVEVEQFLEHFRGSDEMVIVHQ